MKTDFSSLYKRLLRNIQPEHAASIRRSVDVLTNNNIIDEQSLMRAVLDTNYAHRSTAVWAAGRTKINKFTVPLLDILQDAYSSKELKTEAAHSLSMLAKKNDVQSIVTLLQNSKDTLTCELAAYALGMAGDKRAAEPLIRVLEDKQRPSNVRAQAAEALGYLDVQDSVYALVSALNDHNAQVRFWSAFALGLVADEQVLPDLERTASSDDEYVEGWRTVKEEAAEAIANIRYKMESKQSDV